jgi:hypothetical protein
LFARLKQLGAIVEYVPEYAKKLVWAEKFSVLNEQYFVSRKQFESIHVLCGRVQFVITDGSLLHRLHYNRTNPNNVSNVEATEKQILAWYSKHDNVNVVLSRGEYKYEAAGREQNEEQARVIDVKLRELLDAHHIEYHVFASHESSIEEIVKLVLV